MASNALEVNFVLAAFNASGAIKKDYENRYITTSYDAFLM